MQHAYYFDAVLAWQIKDDDFLKSSNPEMAQPLKARNSKGINSAQARHDSQSPEGLFDGVEKTSRGALAMFTDMDGDIFDVSIDSRAPRNAWHQTPPSRRD